MAANRPTSPATYAERLSEAMSDAKIDTRRLSELVGCTYQAIAKALNGGSAVLDTVNNDKAAHVLGVSPSWLARGYGPKRFDAAATEALRLMATRTWPFTRMTVQEWDALGRYQVVVEHAAVEVARKLLLELHEPPSGDAA